jgi:hypothetical protein
MNDAQLKISDLTLKVTWLLIWAFLDPKTMKQMKAFLRKEPTEGGNCSIFIVLQLVLKR